MSTTLPPSLALIELLSGLSPRELAEVEPRVHVRSYRPDQTIVAFKDPTRDVFFILGGRVRVTIFSRSGREITYRDLDVGHSFGELSAIDGEPRSANVIARTNALVGTITAQDFMQLLRRYPVVMEATLRLLSRRVRQLSDRVAEFARPGRARVCIELLRIAQAYRVGPGARIVPAPNRTDVASRVNINREEVSRTIKLLEQLGLAKRERLKALVIHDLDRLADWADRIEDE
jgi:CRP-like cAMP-binding protein